MKSESTLRLSITLAIITALVVGILAFANDITKDIIAQRQVEAQNNAMRAVFTSSVDSVDMLEFTEDKENSTESVTLYKGTMNTELVGYAANVVTNGYGGPITMIVGIDNENKVTGVQIVSASETAGLGAKASEPEFTAQYEKKTSGIEVVKTNAIDNQITAITGATVTSKAVTDGVNLALEAVSGILN